MAVAFDASMTAGNSADGLNQEAAAATSISSAAGMTVGGSGSLLIAVFVWQNLASLDIVSRSATWNGVAMTEGPTILQSTGVERLRVSIFSLVSPATGAKTLAGAWTNSADCYMSAASFSGTDLVTGILGADSVMASASTQISVPSSSDGATVAVFGVNGNAPTVNFNKIFSESPLNPGGGASWQLAGSSNLHTFTGAGGTIQSLAGVHVIAPSGGGGGGSTPAGPPAAKRYIGWTA